MGGSSSRELEAAQAQVRRLTLELQKASSKKAAAHAGLGASKLSETEKKWQCLRHRPYPAMQTSAPFGDGLQQKSATLRYPNSSLERQWSNYSSPVG